MPRQNTVTLEERDLSTRAERGFRRAARTTTVSVLVLVTLAAMLSSGGAGCAVDLPFDDPTAVLSDDPAPAADPKTAIVTIRFRNLAVDEAVNVEFYATNEPLVSLPDDLFVERNLVTAGVGIAGTGILEPLRDDTVEFPCTEHLVVGTLGGTFLDNETGETRGTGVARWAQDAALGLCGHKILFEFVNEFGTFSTRIAVGN